MEVNKINQAIILAGGFGSRLKKLVKKTPKPLLKFKNNPFLFYLTNELEKAGIKKIIILAGYKGEKIKKYFCNKKNIKVLIEKKPLGTYGSILSIKHLLEDIFILMNGDSFLNINMFSKIKSFFLKKTKNSKIFLTKNKNYKSNSLLSNLNINKKNFVYFTNKNKHMYSGISFLYKKDVLKNNKKIFPISLEEKLIPKLIKQKKIIGEINNEEFIDIGTPKNFAYAKKNINSIFQKKCFFFDRDNTLIYDKGYTYKKKDLKWKPGAIKSIRYLNKKNYLVIVITNQSGVARGYFSETNVINFHNHMNYILKKKHAMIDDFFFCPFHPEGKGKYKKVSKNRKPNNGMIEEAIKKWNINRNKSFFIGDTLSDKIASKKSKINFFYIKKNCNIFDIVQKIVS